ncbi:MAG: glutamine-hydrolyzing GMP synthase, partial [Candidatus Cloacimonetes bacterium]|nr:glutamine-hydrolyzing GMP synthase [Candidatus Cloacimonadota bacterium]
NKWMLVQGTIYPDTIESGGTEKSSKIKTHHNRVKEIDKLIEQGKVIEPLQELYKDEVRQLGSELDLPQKLINRQPFPGPGLAIRVICSNGKIGADYKVGKNKFSRIAAKFNLNGRILPVRSVGVQGDFRTYHHPALIWNKEGDKIDWENIRTATHEMINNLTEVNRVVYSPEPVLGKLNLGELYLTKDNLDLLREVDYVVRKNLQNIKEIWQAPVILLPLYTKSQRHVFVIRPVCSSDGMTADFYKIEPWLLRKIIKDVRDQINESALIFYDVTTKPPGTIEWE